MKASYAQMVGRIKRPIKVLGDWDIDCCSDCPHYEWLGETASRGNLGVRCKKGAFYEHDFISGYVHENCPYRSTNNNNHKGNQ